MTVESDGYTCCRKAKNERTKLKIIKKKYVVKEVQTTYVSSPQCGVNFAEVSFHCIDVAAITLRMRELSIYKMFQYEDCLA